MTSEGDSRAHKQEAYKALIEQDLRLLIAFYENVSALAYHKTPPFIFSSSIYSRTTFLTMNAEGTRVNQLTTTFVRADRSVVEHTFAKGKPMTEDEFTRHEVLHHIPLAAVDRMGLSIVTDKGGLMTRNDYSWHSNRGFRDAMLRGDNATIYDFTPKDLLLSHARADYPSRVPQTEADIEEYLYQQNPGLKTSPKLPEIKRLNPSTQEVYDLLEDIDKQWAQEAMFIRYAPMRINLTRPVQQITEDMI